MKNDTSLEAILESLPDACANFSARRLSRILTIRYDKALAPVSLTSAQFSLLAALSKSGGMPLTKLADLLDLERTTLTRNMAVLQKNKLAEVGKGKDARMHVLSITPAGKQRLIKALPLWQKVQSEIGADLIVKKLHEIIIGEASV